VRDMELRLAWVIVMRRSALFFLWSLVNSIGG